MHVLHVLQLVKGQSNEKIKPIALSIIQLLYAWIEASVSYSVSIKFCYMIKPSTAFMIFELR